MWRPVFFLLALFWSSAVVAQGASTEVASLSRFPLDSMRDAASQQATRTAVGDLFKWLNDSMSSALIGAGIEDKILDVAVRASTAMKSNNSKGYLVAVNIYRQASGVPAWGSDFLVDLGTGDNPAAAHLTSAKSPSFRPAPYSTAFDPDRSFFLWFERDGASVIVRQFSSLDRQFIEAKTRAALAAPSVAGKWAGTIVVESVPTSMTLQLEPAGDAYKLSYTMAGRGNRDICIQSIDVVSRTIQFRPSCRSPSNSLLFSLNISSDYKTVSGQETDSSDMDVKYPISLQRQ
jgi:hypothetical protein